MMLFLCSSNYVIELTELRCVTLTGGPSILQGQKPVVDNTLSIYLKGEDPPIQINFSDAQSARATFEDIISRIPDNIKTSTSRV